MDIFASAVTIAELVALYLPVIIGAYISFALMKIPDLSIESAFVCGALLGAKMLMLCSGMPITICLLVALVASATGGMLIGFISGFLTQVCRLPHLLSSIVTIGLFHGIGQLCIEAYLSLSAYPNPLTVLPRVIHHPELITLLCISAGAALLAYLFFKTELGYACAIYGDNPLFFTHYHSSSRFIFMMGTMISGALAGIGGYLFAQTNNYVTLSMGIGKPLFCITVLLLGKIVLPKNRLSVGMPLAGVIVYFLIMQFLLNIGFDLKYFTAVQAIMVAVIVGLHFYKHRSSKNVNQLGI